MKNIKKLFTTACLSLALTTLFLDTFAMESRPPYEFRINESDEECKQQILDLLIHYAKQHITFFENACPGNEYSQKIENISKKLFELIRQYAFMWLRNDVLKDVFFEHYPKILDSTCLKCFYICIPNWEVVYKSFALQYKHISYEEINHTLTIFLQNTTNKQMLLNPITEPITSLTESVASALERHHRTREADELRCECASTISALDIKNFNGYETWFLNYLTQATYHDVNYRLTQDKSLNSFVENYYSPLSERQQMIRTVLKTMCFNTDFFRLF